MHRADISIKTSPDILDIENNSVNICHLFGSWSFLFPINGDNRDSGFDVFAVFYNFPRIGNPSEAMFRGKDHFHLESVFYQSVQQVRLNFVVQDGSLVDNQPDPFILQQSL